MTEQKPKAQKVDDRTWKVTVPVSGTVEYEVRVHDDFCDEQMAIETAMSGDFCGQIGQSLDFHWEPDATLPNRLKVAVCKYLLARNAEFVESSGSPLIPPTSIDWLGNGITSAVLEAIKQSHNPGAESPRQDGGQS